MLVFCLLESISSSFICTKCYCYLWWRYLWNWACFNKVLMLWNRSLVLQNAQTYWYDQWIKSHKIMPKSIHSYSVSCLNAAVIFDIWGQRTMLVSTISKDRMKSTHEFCASLLCLSPSQQENSSCLLQKKWH